MNNNIYKKIVNILTSREKFHISLGLERMKEILKLLGNPEEKLQIIQIAGTNGKGSTSKILSEILINSKYKTGFYSSPHIIKYNERIKINNEDISNENLYKYLIKIEKIAKDNNIYLTEFEILTTISLLYFYNKKVDIVILETGLGGRFDATNICNKNLCSIITSISLDHTERLGKTIEKIAYEKAGIIKKNGTIIISKDNQGYNIIKNFAKEQKAEIIDFDVKVTLFFENNVNYVKFNNHKYEFNLLGLYQKDNLELVLKTIKFLNNKNFNISDDIIEKSLKSVKWCCRFDYKRRQNLIIDGTHNPDGAKKFRETLNYYFPNKKFVWIYGSLQNKDFISISKYLFKNNEEIYFYEFADNSLSFEEFQKYYPSSKKYTDLNDITTDNNTIKIIIGSFYMISSIFPNYDF